MLETHRALPTRKSKGAMAGFFLALLKLNTAGRESFWTPRWEIKTKPLTSPKSKCQLLAIGPGRPTAGSPRKRAQRSPGSSRSGLATSPEPVVSILQKLKIKKLGMKGKQVVPGLTRSKYIRRSDLLNSASKLLQHLCLVSPLGFGNHGPVQTRKDAPS